MNQTPLPVHVCSETPTSWDETEALQRRPDALMNDQFRARQRPDLARNDLDWTGRGLEPRWIGFDTANCTAALQPSLFHGQGADEFDRFRAGAGSRGETAVVISRIGKADDGGQHSMLFGPFNDSVWLGRIESQVRSRPLGVGATVRQADGLDGADQLLALRMLSSTPALHWHTLSLDGVTHQTVNGENVSTPAQGTLVALIETELGEPVVAAWLSPDRVERRYLVPTDTPWPLLLDWLVEQALPEFVPAAMQRARRHLWTDPTLMTRRERLAQTTLTELEADYITRRSDLQLELRAAHQSAGSVRDGLLYGTGQRLVDAVHEVLELAGITVVDVDKMLGDTKSADLLCTFDDRSRLVEVKSARGSATERLYQDLIRHLREWPALPGAVRVDGGALVVNHEHRLPHGSRSSKPFNRPEFLAAQTEPIIATPDLLAAWRDEDWSAIRQMLFGGKPLPPTAPRTSPPARPGPVSPKRGWFARGRRRDQSSAS